MASLGSTDLTFMERALALATQAAAFASPNPTVGCVLVRNDMLLGEGAHFYEARDHAEVAALKQAAEQGRTTAGATAYVTLEPCSHHGRTGPCADALLRAGIMRCVVATVDPNPAVRGKGVARLRDAGVMVEVLSPESPPARRARQLNDAFAFAIQHGRPFVTLKAAVSSDGMIAPAPQHRSRRAPHWLTGPAARADVQHLRHASDAVLTGIGTVLADNPSLTDRTGLPRRRPLLRVVLDSHLRTPLESALVQSAAEDVLLFCSDAASRDRESALQSRGVQVVRLGATQRGLNLPAVLQALQARMVRSVLAEGGSALNTHLLEARLADLVVLYRAPVALGSRAVPFATEEWTPDAVQASLMQVRLARFEQREGEDVRVSGYLHDPWADVPSA